MRGDFYSKTSSFGLYSREDRSILLKDVVFMKEDVGFEYIIICFCSTVGGFVNDPSV